MVNVSLREAVKLYEVSRPTLTKALNSGKISGVRDGKGHWKIDPAELARVYRPKETEQANSGKGVPVKFTAMNTPENSEIQQLKSALAVAEARANAAETLAQERSERIEDLRRMLPPPTTEKVSRGLWSRIVGKK